jgi:putative flippase GtrA
MKLIDLVLRKTDNLLIQFFRYFGVSGICLLADTVTLFVLTEYAGIHYQVSTFIGYSLGLILNYLLSVIWVFKTKRLSNKTMEFGIFVVIGLIGLAINQGVMWLCTDLIGFYFMLSRLISAGVGYTWKFFARKYILFHRRNNKK